MISWILSTLCLIVWGILTGRITYAAVETYRDFLKGQIDTWWGAFKFNWGYYGRDSSTAERVSWVFIAWLAQCILLVFILGHAIGKAGESVFARLFDKIGRWL